MRRPDQAGFVTVQHVFAVGITLVLFTLLVELVLFQYAAGVARAAADEAARAGSRLAAVPGEALTRCEHRGQEALDSLLGGRLGDGLTVACAREGDLVVASVRGSVAGWLPLSGDHTIDARARAWAERAP